MKKRKLLIISAIACASIAFSASSLMQVQANSSETEICYSHGDVVISAMSVSDMKTKSLKVNDIVETLCYSNVNDGGGARYVITESTAQADNGSVHDLGGGLKAELIVTNNSVDVRQFGAKVGLNADVKANTTAIQNAINFAANKHTVVFPSGWIVTDSLNLGTGKNITLKGTSNNMGSYMNKNAGDTYSKILYIPSQNSKPLFTQEKSIMIFDDLGLYGSTTANNKEYGVKGSTLLEGDVVLNSIDYKGKVFANNCEFSGWGTVFGGARVKVDSDDKPTLSFKTSSRKEGSNLQVSVLATDCRFSNNDIAISQLVDSRIVGCSFNKNKYAIVFGPKSGFSTIANCRIEWNNYNGTYIDSAHDISINNNEYDRNGRAGIFVINAENINITNNLLRRNGADEKLKEYDYDNNVHLYVKNTSNSNISNNITKVKYNYDLKINSSNESGKKGIYRPSNVSYFENNTGISVSNNILNGGNRKEESLNVFENNVNSSITGNITKK